MENNNHDCLFVVVDAGKISVTDKMFQVFYPIWYKLKRLPSRLFMMYTMAMKKRQKFEFNQ